MPQHLCANHTRNSPVDAFLRLFTTFLTDSFCLEFDAAVKAAGGNTRLEKDLPSFLRSMCKLSCWGNGAHAKGDGLEMLQWLQENHPELYSIEVGKAELGSRQDWMLKVASKMLPLLRPLTGCLTSTLVLDPNILRDLTLQRLELHYFEAGVHASAIMWDVAFSELRSLTNLKTMHMNPFQANKLHDQLWAMADLLKGPHALAVLDDNCRPWDKVRTDNAECRNWCANRDTRKAQRLRRLRTCRDRPDAEECTVVLRQVLALFSEGTQEPFQRTMSDCLEDTNGDKAFSKTPEWRAKQDWDIHSHNNAAERPFAVIKALKRLFPSTKLSYLPALSLAKVNGTYAVEETGGKHAKTKDIVRSFSGKATIADPILQRVMSKLCCVRSTSLGLVTIMLKRDYVEDVAAAAAHRKEPTAFKLKEAARLASTRMTKADAAMETELTRTKVQLLAELKSVTSTAGKRGILGKQHDRKTVGEKRKCDLSQVPVGFRDKCKKIKKWPAKGEDKQKHVQELVLKMIAADADTAAPETMALPTNLVRRPQMTAPEHTSALSKRVKAEQLTTMRKASAPEDDPVGVPLLAKHRMKLFCENEGPKKKHHQKRILDVRYLPKRSGWVTCSAPVEKTAAGQWEIPAQHLVQGEGNADAVVKVTSRTL
jgi:hypothetical protein